MAYDFRALWPFASRNASPRNLIWGVGPAWWVFPTATSDLLGHANVSIGPSCGRWIIPFGGGGRITRLGFQPVSMRVNFYGNAVHTVGLLEHAPWKSRSSIRK